MTAEHKDIFERILERKVAFFAVFFVVFMLTYAVLYAIDFVPEDPETNKDPVVEVIKQEPRMDEEPLVRADADPYPDRIFIDALDREVPILNPQNSSIAALDAALLEGVVRHPDSADLTDNGTVVLFGHSSYLPHVFNRNFQAFNGIQELTWGDHVRLQSSDMEYTYRVTKVYKVKASEADVMLDNSSAKLTLVTCNSFGSKDDRFVVEAELINTRTI